MANSNQLSISAASSPEERAPEDKLPIQSDVELKKIFPGAHIRRQDSIGSLSPPDSPHRSEYTSGRGTYKSLRGGESSQALNQTRTSSVLSFGGTNTLRYRTDDATEQLVERRAKEVAQWRIHWVTPTLMIALFFLGVLGAMSHHFFYLSLNGKPANVERQLWMIRAGTALAYFTKAALVGSVILSYRQRIWHTFRRKAMTMGAIDGLFSVTEDPSNFFNFEVYKNAKLSMVMALAAWLIPIAALLSPASLTSGPSMLMENATCDMVPNLDFSREGRYNFRDETVFSGGSIIYYNTTDRTGGDGYFDYYDQPSRNARRLLFTSVFLKRAVTLPTGGLSEHTCEGNFNCTWSITFKAPSYDCSPIDDDMEQLRALGVPFNYSTLAPQGSMIYIADVDQGNEYRSPQVPTTDSGTPAGSPPYPDDMGVLKYEPRLFIGYSHKTNDTYPADSQFATRWENVHIPGIFQCEHKETEYEVQIETFEQTQTSHVIKRTFLAPIINTTLVTNAQDASSQDAEPQANWVRPNTNVELYKQTAVYHAVGQLFRNFLRGSITKYGTANFPVTRSDLSETAMVNLSTSYPADNLMEKLQSVYQDMVLTLLSEPRLAIAHPISTSCVRSRYEIVFTYQRSGLWIGYSVVIGVALIGLIIGGWSLYDNGVASDTLFSRILVTCRNPTLDRLSVGACLGSDPFPMELKRTKLRFGVLLEENEEHEVVGRGEGLFGRVEHCAFGTVGETKPIVKYGTYAGLRKWMSERRDMCGSAEKRALLEPLNHSDEDGDAT